MGRDALIEEFRAKIKHLGEMINFVESDPRPSRGPRLTEACMVLADVAAELAWELRKDA